MVVLTNDSFVRSYDLMTSPDTPDQEIELVQQNDNAGMAGLAALEEVFEPVSICFGKAGEPHGKLTLYVMSREGDIYSVCPYVPKSFILTQNELEELFDSAVASEFEYRHSEDSLIPVRRHYKAQLDWISELWKQIPMTITETRAPRFGATPESYVVLTRPKSKATPVVQGPFSLEPYPEEYYGISGVDIESMDAGITVFCLSFENDSVLLATSTQDVDLSWSDTVDLGSALAIVESIPLAGKIKGVHVDGEAFYVLGEISAYRIDPSPWVLPIANALKDGDLDTFVGIMRNAPKSKVAALINPRDKLSLLGTCTFRDSEGSLYTVTVTRRVWIEKWTSKDDIATPKVPLSKAEKKPENATYLGSPFEAEQALAAISFNPPLANTKLLTKHMELDWDTLTTLNQLGEFYGGELAKLHRIGLSMHGRLVDQRTELHRQLETAAGLPKKLQALAENDPTQRAKEAVERQEALQARIEKLRSGLNKPGIVLVSDQEKKWGEELQRLKSIISENRGLDHRVKVAVVQSNVIVNESKLQKLNSERGLVKAEQQRSIPGLETETSIRLKQALAREGEIVAQTKATLDDLLKGMEKLTC